MFGRKSARFRHPSLQLCLRVDQLVGEQRDRVHQLQIGVAVAIAERRTDDDKYHFCANYGDFHNNTPNARYSERIRLETRNVLDNCRRKNAYSTVKSTLHHTFIIRILVLLS